MSLIAESKRRNVLRVAVAVGCASVAIPGHLLLRIPGRRLPGSQAWSSVDPGTHARSVFSCDQKKHRPELWIHGHTHVPCDYELFDTHIVRNPGGYPGENCRAEFRDDLLVSIG
jgi:hypothetical protein